MEKWKNEAERDLGEHGQRGDRFVGDKAQTLEAQTPQAVGADQDAGDQIGSDSRETQFLGQTRHHQAGQHRDRNAKQSCHNGSLFHEMYYSSAC